MVLRCNVVSTWKLWMEKKDDYAIVILLYLTVKSFLILFNVIFWKKLEEAYSICQ